MWSSDGRQLPYGRAEDALSRSPEPLNVHTNDDRRAFIAVDLGLSIIPSAYTLRHARGYGRSALRNWLFQVSTEIENVLLFVVVFFVVEKEFDSLLLKRLSILHVIQLLTWPWEIDLGGR